ncbi:hypothetical protein SAMN05216420_101410 [Nitrosospira sp. Nl5]|nr:hypothetical protein SAMN05216420_101410 [Nitrosospira sp. Nl5]
MGAVTKRITKGSALTLEEYDANLDAVNILRTLPTGEWKQVPSLFRLLLKGTGTCTVDARNTAGTITAGLYIYTAAAATNQIEYPYLGADAIEIRVTLTGTCTAEVI